MPASSSASQDASSSSRCCGSIASASRGAIAEEAGVEPGGVVRGSRPRGRSSCPSARGRGRRGARGPSRGRRGSRAIAVAARGEQLPELLGGVDAAGIAAAHADDRDRLLAEDRAAPDGRALAPASPSTSAEQVAGDRARRSGSRRPGSPASCRPVAAPSRLRSSTAASESKPRSLKARSGSIASAEAWPSTAATWSRTRLSTMRLALRLGQAWRGGGPASPPAAGARRGAGTSPRSTGGSTPAAAGACSAARSKRAAATSARRLARAASKSARPSPSESGARGPARPHPRHVGLAQAGWPSRSRAPTAPRRSRWRAGPRPGGAAARASRKAVGGGVVALAGGAEDPGERGEETKWERSSPAVSSCRCQAASALGAKTRLELLGVERPRASRRRARAAQWITAPSGCSAGTWPSSSSSSRALGDVAGGDRHLGAELLPARRAARRRRARPRRGG